MQFTQVAEHDGGKIGLSLLRFLQRLEGFLMVVPGLVDLPQPVVGVAEVVEKGRHAQLHALRRADKVLLPPAQAMLDFLGEQGHRYLPSVRKAPNT